MVTRRSVCALAVLLAITGASAASAGAAEHAAGEEVPAREPEIPSAEDEAEITAAAERAMGDLQSGLARQRLANKEQQLQKWEAEMAEKVDAYLRRVAEVGPAGEVVKIQIPDKDEDRRGASAEAPSETPGAAAEQRDEDDEEDDEDDEEDDYDEDKDYDDNEDEGEEETPPAEAKASQEQHGSAHDSRLRELEAAEDALLAGPGQSSVEVLQRMAEDLRARIPQTPPLRRRLEQQQGAEGPEGASPARARHPPISAAMEKARAQARARNGKSIAWGGIPDPDLSSYFEEAQAAYLVAALAASGIAGPAQELNDTYAVQLLHASALAGSIEAQLALADRYLAGRGVPKSCSVGVEHMKVVADHASESAEKANNFHQPLPTVRLRDRWLDPNYVDAHELENGAAQIEMEEDMARRGSAAAQRHLGFRRLLGQGVEADPEQALREFQAAAGEGDPYAMFNLGFMHLRGVGAPQDNAQAMNYFRQATVAGLAAAHNGIGVMHFNGQGTPQNLTAAKEAFEAGALAGDADSMFNLGTMHRSGFGVPMNLTLGHKYFQDAYQAGHWKAGHSLALLAEIGYDSVEANCTDAAHYLREFIAERFTWVDQLNEAQKAHDEGKDWRAIITLVYLAEQGCEQAEANLAFLLQRGTGYVGDDRYSLALRMLLRSGSRGGSDSYVEAGNLVLNGAEMKISGGDRPEYAMELYKRAAQAGEIEAYFLQGWMHDRGIGVPRNLTAAAEMYQKAIDRAHKDDPALAATLALLAVRAQQTFERYFWWLISSETRTQPRPSSGSGSSAPLPGAKVAASWRRSDSEWDTLLLGFLVGALAAVLYVRWARIQSRLSLQARLNAITQAQPQVAADPADDTDEAAPDGDAPQEEAR